jgi:hypothetical protein
MAALRDHRAFEHLHALAVAFNDLQMGFDLVADAERRDLAMLSGFNLFDQILHG